MQQDYPERKIYYRVLTTAKIHMNKHVPDNTFMNPWVGKHPPTDKIHDPIAP